MVRGVPSLMGGVWEFLPPQKNLMFFCENDAVWCMEYRDVTDSESESDGIRQFFRNPKSDGYLKSDRDGFKILVSVQLKCYFRK